MLTNVGEVFLDCTIQRYYIYTDNYLENLQSCPGMIGHSCNPSTQELQARGWWILGQPRQQSKTLSQKTKQSKTKMLTNNCPKSTHEDSHIVMYNRYPCWGSWNFFNSGFWIIMLRKLSNSIKGLCWENVSEEESRGHSKHLYQSSLTQKTWHKAFNNHHHSSKHGLRFVLILW
jgi:hypothetical protein